MYLIQMFAEESGSTFSSAYVCTSEDCDRCYNKGAGYFDFIGGKTNLDDRQMLSQKTRRPADVPRNCALKRRRNLAMSGV